MFKVGLKNISVFNGISTIKMDFFFFFSLSLSLGFLAFFVFVFC